MLMILLSVVVCVFEVGEAYEQYSYQDYSHGLHGGVNDYYQDYMVDDHNYQYQDYVPIRRGYRERENYNYRHYHNKPSMQSYKKSYRPMPEKVFVPVIIKKKSSKKRKIISVHHGFYVPGGTQAFGKFKDLYSCKKACEITPTCFAGDFNPWLGKCYFHGNLTGCGSMRAHKAVIHFKKIPCAILESTRGFIVLGVNVINGIEIKGIKSLSDCIKKCATAGGGVAALASTLVTEGQVCCHLDYDFATHKCYFHACVNTAIAVAQFCPAVDTIVDPPLNSLANPTTISITICPRSKL